LIKGNLLLYKPKKIYLDPSAKGYPLTEKICSAYADVPIEEIRNPRQIINEILRTPDPITFGKQFLLLTRQRGRFLKRCPGTKNYLCCGYKILNTANNCDLDCSYCILQGYFTNPLMLVYVNLPELFAELDQTFKANPGKFYRIGTGELTDSLTLEPVTGYGRALVEFFRNYDNAIIELKTKSIFIDDLLELKHNRRTVISWSLNTEMTRQHDEAKTPGIDERLAAATRCQEAGYWLGFHFDPMIHTENWQSGYRATLEKLFARIDGKNIAWISLGALRYPPYLDSVIRQRHPASKIVFGEFISGKDQKYRYFKPIRIEMFQKMVAWIREWDPSVFVYLCMESDEVWQKAFGWSPGKMSQLSRLLDERVKPNLD
jgi:spore photoproduct lyase